MRSLSSLQNWLEKGQYNFMELPALAVSSQETIDFSVELAPGVDHNE